MRHAIVMRRCSHQIEDLGAADWSIMSKTKQMQKARPSHIMMCLFHEKPLSEPAPDQEDYTCPSCAERTGPKKTTPGNLKDPKEFNECVSLDGFDWTGQKGFHVHVLHILDEATRFHVARRTVRDSQAFVQSV